MAKKKKKEPKKHIAKVNLYWKGIYYKKGSEVPDEIPGYTEEK